MRDELIRKINDSFIEMKQNTKYELHTVINS